MTVARHRTTGLGSPRREVQGRSAPDLAAPARRSAALSQRASRLLRRQPLRGRGRLQPRSADLLLLARHGDGDDRSRADGNGDHDLHGPARPHSLPPVGLQGLHTAADGPARAGHPRPLREPARCAGRKELVRLRAGLRRPSPGLRHRRVARCAARGPGHGPGLDRRELPPRPRAGHVQRRVGRGHGQAHGICDGPGCRSAVVAARRHVHGPPQRRDRRRGRPAAPAHHGAGGELRPPDRKRRDRDGGPAARLGGLDPGRQPGPAG